VLLLSAQPLSAQNLWTARASVTAGVQIDTGDLNQSFTRTKNVEPAPIDVALSAAAVPFFEGGIAVRIVGNLGAGVSFSSLSRSADADVTAEIPHPFFFNRPRAISGVASVDHKEIATHLSAVYVIPSPRLDLAVSGGLSFFNVTKDFVDDVGYQETFPYDSATFSQAVLLSEDMSEQGWHVAADVIFRFSRRFGAGGLVRYATASVPFTKGDRDVGGLQLGGGLRVIF
jgi:hypothetical protein